MDDSRAIVFECLTFNQLSLAKLYEVMALRQTVFVVEQDCPYLDADGHDQQALHLMGYQENNKLVSYARLFGPEQYYPKYASIGRVITDSAVRGKGIGQLLIQEAIRQIHQHFGPVAIKISAQSYLTKFYESFGFETFGDTYLEDGIPHIAMIRNTDARMV